MTVYRRKESGSYYYEFLAEGQRYRRSVGKVTRRLAELAEQAEKARVAAGRVARVWGVRDDSVAAARDVPTLAEYARLEEPPGPYVRDHLQARLAPSTQKSARSQIRRLVARLGRRRLDELTPTVLDRYTTARLADVAAAAVREEIERLSRIVNHARARGILRVHPFAGWRRPAAEGRDYHVVTPEEERRLLRAARADFRPMLQLALATGLRKGELRLLETSAVEIVNRRLRITQPKVAKARARRRQSAVKTIDLAPADIAMLRGLFRGPRSHEVYVFSKPGGGPWSSPWIDRRWMEALRRAKLAGIRFNDLRHTFASRLAAQGASIPVVAELLGHIPPYTTTLRYFHALEGEKRAAILRLRGTKETKERKKSPQQAPHRGPGSTPRRGAVRRVR